MATYVIGDLQGSWLTLRHLLDTLRFDPAGDRLWSVGDLVNRGPRSLEVLRFFHRLGDRAVAVLGNHDVHLLARAAGARPASAGDTLDAVLAAPDRDPLLDWLRRRPFLHREGRWLMVHAGLLPQWTEVAAAGLARELEEAFRGEGWREGLAAIRAAPGLRSWSDELAGAERLRGILDVFTCLRTCRDGGAPCFGYTGAPAGAPAGCRPWFELREPGADSPVVLFGHWAALGYHRGPGAIGLDTGCGWGNLLTAVRLEDGAHFEERFRD